MKEKSPLFLRTIALISEIPAGKVATYAHVANLIGAKGCARHVSYILSSSSAAYDLPWHRVINSQGKISLKVGSGFFKQEKLLKKEGITFNGDKVDLKTYLWHPSQKLLNKTLSGIPTHTPLAVR